MHLEELQSAVRRIIVEQVRTHPDVRARRRVHLGHNVTMYVAVEDGKWPIIRALALVFTTFSGTSCYGAAQRAAATGRVGGPQELGRRR